MKKPKLPEKGCHSCRYWHEVTETGDEGRSGICRRYPPVGQITEDGITSCQPFTDPEGWCGEHHPVEH